MGEVISQDTRLSADLPTITAEINAYKRVAGEAIFEIGRRLKHVKENDLAHGQWMRWLADEVQFTDRQARRFMQVVDEFKTDDVVRIGSSKIFELLQLPSDIDRSDFVSKPHTIPSTGAEKTVDEMTVRELREVKAALKAEREARERAEAARENRWCISYVDNNHLLIGANNDIRSVRRRWNLVAVRLHSVEMQRKAIHRHVKRLSVVVSAG